LVEVWSMSKDKAQIHEKVQSQYAPVASAYVSSKTHAHGPDLQLMLDLAGDVKGKTILDVATGGGHTALAFAREGASVIVSDLTQEMLTVAENFIKEQGFELEYVQSAAEDLAFENTSFDLITCRIAAHHFASPQTFLQRCYALLKEDGLLFLNDNITAEPASLANFINRIERLRDPSHIEAYTVKQWMDMLAEAGFELLEFRRWKKKFDFWAWFERMKEPIEVGKAIEQDFRELESWKQEYFELEFAGERLEHMSYEGGLFVVRKIRH